MRSKYLKFFFLLIPVLLLTSCSEDPSTVGINQLNSDLVDIKDYDTQSDTIRQTASMQIVREAYQSSYRTMLGAAEDGLESSVYFRYDLYNYMPDSIKAIIKEDSINVIKSFMYLYPTYAYPSSGYTNFDFNVYKINSVWYAYGFTVDSVAKYLPSGSLGTSSIKSYGPVMKDSLMYFEIKPSAAKEMLVAEADTGGTTDYGFVLKPIPGSNKIIGFTAYGVYDTLPRLAIIIESKKYNNYYIDTLKFTPASDVHVFEKGNLPAKEDGYFALRAGLSVQTHLEFDFARADGKLELPANAIINSAQLVLKPDYTKSKICDTNYVSLYATCIGIDSATTADLKNAAVIMKKDGDYYTGDITYFVQRWMKPGWNKGVDISMAYGGMSADKIVFVGSDSKKVADRPRLKITYTVKQ